MKTIKLFPVCIILLGVACTHPPTTQAVYRNVTAAVFASGHIEAVGQYNLTANADGYLVHQYVHEGDTLQDNQPMFDLDNLQQQVQLNSSMANLAISKLNASDKSPVLSQLHTAITNALIKMRNDSVNADRYKHLYATHSVAKSDYDNAVLSYQSSLNTYKGLLDNYTATQLQQNQLLINAQSQADVNQTLNHYYSLRAMKGFKVYKIPPKVGELISKGNILAVLGRKDSLLVKLDIDENDIAKVKLGQKVLVQLNTDKKHTIEAVLVKIYPDFDDNLQSFIADALFVQNPGPIIVGTQLQANIITEEKKHVLMIPKIYLTKSLKVLVQRDKEIDSVAIQTGASDDKMIEVLNGITDKDNLVLPK